MLFCEISSLTYKISVYKGILLRNIKDFFSNDIFAKTKSMQLLPIVVYNHTSLIRRKLGNVNMTLQENKAINLRLSTPKVTNILIRPGEIFSFWKLVGSPSAKNGYREGVAIKNGKVVSGIGGGICQFTNLIHWLVLHTPMEIVEHHHHDRFDLFPDFNRQIPFGTGTSIMYNYMDYRFKNTTNMTYQLIIYTTEDYLCGEMRSSDKLPFKYKIGAENEKFIQKNDVVYRTGQVYRKCIDVKTGNSISRELIRSNYAKVMYDSSALHITTE